MKDIQQVLRKKRAQLAQLNREIELLQEVEEKLREVAPLLADAEDDTALLTEVEEENRETQGASARAASASSGSAIPAPRTTVPRWP